MCSDILPPPYEHFQSRLLFGPVRFFHRFKTGIFLVVFMALILYIPFDNMICVQLDTSCSPMFFNCQIQIVLDWVSDQKEHKVICFILHSEIQSAYKMYLLHMPHRNITKGTQWNQICMSDLSLQGVASSQLGSVMEGLQAQWIKYT